MIDLRMFGTELDTIVKYEDGIKHKYKVDEIFQFHVKCHDENGNVECFNMGDLVTMGKLASGGQRFTNPFNRFD